MVKFNEAFEFLDYRSRQTECDCCKQTVEKAGYYKRGDRVTILCDDCKEFIQGVMDE